MKISIVTSNEERYNFVKQTLIKYKINLEKKPLHLNEIQADTLEEVAINKAITAAKQLNGPCICEDTELTIKALNNFPGPYLKFVQEKLISEKIITLLKNETMRDATFRSLLVYAQPNEETKTFETKIDCKILNKKIGLQGRGWDNIILIRKVGKTLAEHTSNEKFNLWNKGYIDFSKWYSKKGVNK
ncbi:MAG: non-canonical purine NTP pyrophosphatase [Candidatus ainarchaeum sp.]|nr:non-canonical purine NTP pyrophosphatase [Candidatus ainarchaeum sp.]